MAFSVAEARRIVADLFQPNPAIYWADFLLSLASGAVCFGLVRVLPIGSVWQLLCFIASVLLYYRAVTFVHELAHLKKGTFKAFRFVWNLLCGIPFLIPSFMYETHLDHHRGPTYGTKLDGEYLPFAHRGPWMIVLFLAGGLFVPLLVVFRFLVLAPLGWVFPGLRWWVYSRGSSLIIDPSYIRPKPPAHEYRIMRLQEAFAFLWCLTMALLVVLVGRWPFPFLIQAYLTAVCILTLNNVRTIAAHRYSSGDRQRMTFPEQVMDSLNFPHRPWFSELWAPVGMRYHALHHLFPSMPYHNLPAAHHRLLEQLPADSPYRELDRVSLLQTCLELWRQSRAAASERIAAAR